MNCIKSLIGLLILTGLPHAIFAWHAGLSVEQWCVLATVALVQVVIALAYTLGIEDRPYDGDDWDDDIEDKAP